MSLTYPPLCIDGLILFVASSDCIEILDLETNNLNGTIPLELGNLSLLCKSFLCFAFLCCLVESLSMLFSFTYSENGAG